MTHLPAPQPWNPWRWLVLGAIFLRELALSSLAVMRATLSPAPVLRPGIVAVPLRLRSAAGVTLLADMVTLTPGTTSLHVSPDRTILYVHALEVDDVEALRRDIAEKLEAPVLRVLR
jgi:multicomponent Na+:H+ antiporter subunit E